MSGSASKPAAMIVGGDSLLREAVGSLLKPIVRETFACEGIGDALMRRVDQTRPDLMVFLDCPRQFQSCPLMLKKLKATYPDIRIMVLSNDLDSERLSDAVAAGIDGYLMRDTTAEALRHALRLVMAGERAYSARVVDLLLQPRYPPRPYLQIGPRPELTNRQRDILSCLVEGQSNKDIARRFGTSEATVKVQVRAVLRRIGVENRTQAAIWAIDAGINRFQTQVTHLRQVN